MLVILEPSMTKAQTERLEKSLADGEIRAWDMPTSLELREVLQAVRRDRVALGHAPSAADKALAAKITRAIRDRASSPKVNVRTTALGNGRFRVHLPNTTAEYAGTASTERTPELEGLERAAGASITVSSVTVSRGDTWYRTVLLQARPDAEAAGDRPGDATGRNPQ